LRTAAKTNKKKLDGCRLLPEIALATKFGESKPSTPMIHCEGKGNKPRAKLALEGWREFDLPLSLVFENSPTSTFQSYIDRT